MLSALPNLVFLAILVMMTRYVLRGARFFFAGLDRGTITLANFDRDWAWPTYRIIRVLIIAFTLVVAYPYIPGSGSEAFKGVSLFLGIIFFARLLVSDRQLDRGVHYDLPAGV